MDVLYRVAYPDADTSQVVNKMHPDCLKLVAIVEKCKFKIPATAANNVINKDGENAFNAAFTHAEIGDFERLYQEETPSPQAKRLVMEKGVWPIDREISRMDSSGGNLVYGRIRFGK